MKIEHFDSRNSIEEKSKSDFLKELEEEDRDYKTFKSKNLKVGTKILVVSAWSENDNGEITKPESLIEIERDTKVKAYDFGKALTSDTYLVLDDGTDKIILICDEPEDITNSNDNEYVGDRHGADYILRHM